MRHFIYASPTGGDWVYGGPIRKLALALGLLLYSLGTPTVAGAAEPEPPIVTTRIEQCLADQRMRTKAMELSMQFSQKYNAFSPYYKEFQMEWWPGPLSLAESVLLFLCGGDWRPTPEPVGEVIP